MLPHNGHPINPKHKSSGKIFQDSSGHSRKMKKEFVYLEIERVILTFKNQPEEEHNFFIDPYMQRIQTIILIDNKDLSVLLTRYMIQEILLDSIFQGLGVYVLRVYQSKQSPSHDNVR